MDGCVLLGWFGAILGSYLALGGCHLGAGWADEGRDVAWLVGCHFLGRGLSEKGSQNRLRAQTMFTHIPNVCLMIFVVFWSTAGWPPNSRDGHRGKPKTHICPMNFDDVSNIGVPKTSKSLETSGFVRFSSPRKAPKGRASSAAPTGPAECAEPTEA